MSTSSLRAALHRPRLYRETPCLPLAAAGVDVGAGGESDVAKQRGVVEVDAGDVAAADEADLQAHDRAPAAKRRIETALTRAKRAKSLGLSCSATMISAPAATHCAQSFGHGMTPGSDVRPAILVSLVARRGDVLDMNERDASAIALHPMLGVRAAARRPRRDRPPRARVAEQMLDRKRPVGRALEIRSRDCARRSAGLGGEARGNLRAAERPDRSNLPPRSAAPRRGQIGRDDDLDAELARDFERRAPAGSRSSRGRNGRSSRRGHARRAGASCRRRRHGAARRSRHMSKPFAWMVASCASTGGNFRAL